MVIDDCGMNAELVVHKNHQSLTPYSPQLVGRGLGLELELSVLYLPGTSTRYVILGAMSYIICQCIVQYVFMRS